MRPVYFLFGWCFFGFGAVGVLVPGLPTVPFMLVALWLFSKSSQRFHDWLYEHRIFGPPLQQWRDHKVIPVKAKVVAVATMVVSLGYMAWGAEVSGTVLGVTASIMLVGATVILRQPSNTPEPVPATGQASKDPDKVH